MSNPELLYEYGYFPKSGYDGDKPYGRAIRYRSGVWATSKRAAELKLKKLNLPQAYLTDKKPSKRRDYKLSSALMVEAFKNRNKKIQNMDAIHSLTFETYLALKSGVACVDSVIGDMGLLHEFTHAIFSKEWSEAFGLEKELVNACLRLELVIPGLLSQTEIASHRKKIATLNASTRKANSYS